MNKIKYLLLFLLPAAITAPSCQTGPDMYTFKGAIQNAGNMQVLLEQVFFDRESGPTAIGRVTTDASGNFTLEQKEPFAAGLYQLTIGAKRTVLVLGGDEQLVELKGNLATLETSDVEVSGSKTMTCYVNVVKEIRASGQLTPESAKGFIDKACNPLMKAFLTLQFYGGNAGNFLDNFKTANQALQQDMPGSRYATGYAKIISSIESQLQAQTPQAGGAVQVGQPAPDISLPGPDGKVRSLSSLKGKVVLLDFWASWCGPCRRENPHVVSVYKKYKDKGFDVFSVSLDRENGKDAWIAAIKQDGLVWDNHVSDLKFWQSAPAVVYGVNSIPRTFLIDREGNVAAINPRSDLEQQLLKLL